MSRSETEPLQSKTTRRRLLRLPRPDMGGPAPYIWITTLKEAYAVGGSEACGEFRPPCSEARAGNARLDTEDSFDDPFEERETAPDHLDDPSAPGTLPEPALDVSGGAK